MHASLFPRRCLHVALTPVPLIPKVQGRERAAGPGEGRAWGGALSGNERGCELQSRERQSGREFKPSAPAHRSGCSHGSPFGKRPLLPSPPHPSPQGDAGTACCCWWESPWIPDLGRRRKEQGAGPGRRTGRNSTKEGRCSPR